MTVTVGQPSARAALFDDRVLVIALVIDDVDRNLGYLIGTGTCGCKGSTEVGERLVYLNREITSADELPVNVFGLLARDKNQLGTPRDNDLSVCFRGR